MQSTQPKDTFRKTNQCYRIYSVSDCADGLGLTNVFNWWRMISLSIICPSRKGPNQEFFLKRVILSIQTQSIREELQLELIICIDNQEKLDFKISEDFVSVVNSHGNSQASALNAGLALANGDFIAIFEDDDLWDREYLRVYTKVFQNTGIDFLHPTK